MSIVAISYTIGSLGDETGREIARVMSYAFANREIITAAADRFGETVIDLERATERKPRLWEHVADTRRRYVTHLSTIILEMAARDNVVLAGRGAPFVLRGVRHAVLVRMTASEQVRAKRLELARELSYLDALQVVRDSDHDLSARARFLHQVNWDDPLLYDLILNTDRLEAAEASRTIIDLLKSEKHRATPESRAYVEDLSVAAAADAALLAHPALRRHPLSVTCSKGRVVISGTVDRKEDQQSVKDAVRNAVGAHEVINEVVVRPYTVT